MIFKQHAYLYSAIFFLLLACSQAVFALGEPTHLKTSAQQGDLVVADRLHTAALYVDTDDYIGVQKAAEQLQTDIEKVSHKRPQFFHTKLALNSQAILIGTLGHSQLIDELVAAKKIDVSAIKDQWDAYQISVIQNPTPTLKQALIIIGSNKRGTTYGIYDIAEKIGVSPWYWWADVPIQHKENLIFSKNLFVQEIPKIKYRGIFLNDEAPALSSWVTKNYGNYNHEFYAKVFELLLRLRANYLWPAMWNNAFNADDPLNKELADEYGIVMGTSHHEPMIRAHKEWTSDKGKWDYHSNKNNLLSFWEGGIARNKDTENLITIGMRGDGDEPMSESENISLLEHIVQDQRQIISNIFNKPAEQVPQVWALYKEVQGYYEKGMRVPDDVTLLWCDDNWGNIRRLPTPDERKRTGGAGVYYHFDYVGGPRSYRWINTISIAKIWEQMNLAYQTNANTVWIVNVGDLKPMEYPIEFFLRMAWNPEQWPKERITEFSEAWAAREFGAEHAKEIAELLTGYTRHNLRRKPELQDESTYSQLNYDEANRVTANIKNLRQRAERLYEKMPDNTKDAFFQLVLHPVKASAIITEMYDMVGKNHLYAQQGRANSNDFAAKARALFAEDAALQQEYDTQLAGGKWAHFMDQPHIGYTHWNNPPANTLPLLYDRQAHGAADMGVAVEGSASAWPQLASSVWPHQGGYQLPRFDPYGQQTRQITVFNKGTTPFNFSLRTNAPWIKTSYTSIQVKDHIQIDVSIDWSKAPDGLGQGKIDIIGTGYGGASIAVSSLKPNVNLNGFKGFIESDGAIVIEAEHFAQAKSMDGFGWQKIPEHGRYLSSISLFPFTDKSFTPLKDAPYVEYHFFTLTLGDIQIESIFAPSLPFATGHGLRFALALDDESPEVIDIVKDISTPAWEESVRSDMRKVISERAKLAAGAHRLRIYAVDAGVTLERIQINTGGLRDSYLGPIESHFIGKK